MTASLTADLGTFVAGMPARTVPPDAAAAIRRGMADCVGVAFASGGEPVLAHARSLITTSANGNARIWTAQAFASAADAAFFNAVAAHALDFDDTGLDGHPSVVLAPVVLAEAERLGASWSQAVTAYAAGYEVWAELSGRDADRHHGKGWHPTAVFGVVACAAASACLRGLDAARAAHALGIAASMAGGLVANFGSMTKPLQVGLASRNGILAAQLAQQGLTASADALESPRGYLSALSPAGRVRLDGPIACAAPWQLQVQGLNIKRYPICYATHRIVDAAISLHGQLKHSIDAVDTVTARIGRLQAAMLRSSRPTNGLDAKFSAEYTIACGLLRGHVDLADLSDASVNEPAVQALLRRVRVIAVEETDDEEPLFSPDDRLCVQLSNGHKVEAEPVHRALGHASRPIPLEALRAKFIACTQGALSEAAVMAWWNAAMAPSDAAVAWPA